MGRISSVSTELDCGVGRCEFNLQERTNTQGLKITEK